MLRKLLYCILLCSVITVQSSFITTDDSISPQQNSQTEPFTPRSLNRDFTDAGEAVKTLTMHGSVAFGYYFTTLYFGTPAQRQTVIVDTGSTITTIPCRECGSSCGVTHLSDYFNPSQSNSFQEMTCSETFGNYECSNQNCHDSCTFDIRYSEGSSYHGRFKKDYVSFDGPVQKDDSSSNHTSLRRGTQQTSEEPTEAEPTNSSTTLFMPFGCTLKETNLFLTQEADGILGLGVDTNNRRAPPNVFDYLHMTNSSISNAFSICMGPTGGYLGVGGYNSTYHASDETVQYVPYDGSRGQYRIHWKGVKFEGELLNIEEGVLNEGNGAYIDSGTTLLYTTHFIARTINDALANFCKKEGNCGGNNKEDICWIYDPEKYPTVEDFFATFGTFTFQFGDDGASEYEWRPEDYLFHYSPETYYYCLGLERVTGKKTLFGGVFMKNHDVLFDKSNKRIGFIRSNCSAEYSLDSYPKNTHSDYSYSEEYMAIMHIIRVSLIAIIAISLLLLLINLLVKYVQSRRLRNKLQSLELGITDNKHHDEVLDPSDSDFRALTGEDNQRFQRLSEDYAV